MRIRTLTIVAMVVLGSMVPASGSSAAQEACTVNSSAEKWTGVGQTYTDSDGLVWHRLLQVTATHTTCGTLVGSSGWRWKLHKPAPIQPKGTDCIRRDKVRKVLESGPTKTDADGNVYRRQTWAFGISRDCTEGHLVKVEIDPWAWHKYPPGTVP